MSVVEAMQAVLEPQTEQQAQEAAAQMREQAAQMREQAALIREQLAEQRAQAQATGQGARDDLRTRIQNDVREALRGGDVGEVQAGALAERIAAQVADEAARAAEAANGRVMTFRRPGQEPMEVQIPNPDLMIPQKAVDLTYAFFATMIIIIVGLPIARAFARRMDRRSAATSPEVSGQLRQLQQSVEAVAIEVERISEAQRFTTRVLTEGAAQPVEVRQGERLAAR